MKRIIIGLLIFSAWATQAQTVMTDSNPSVDAITAAVNDLKAQILTSATLNAQLTAVTSALADLKTQIANIQPSQDQAAISTAVNEIKAQFSDLKTQITAIQPSQDQSAVTTAISDLKSQISDLKSTIQSTEATAISAAIADLKSQIADLKTTVQTISTQAPATQTPQPAASTPVATTPAPTPTQAPAAGTGGIFLGSTEYTSLGDAAAAYKQGDVMHITKSRDNDSVALVGAFDYVVKCDAGVKLSWSAGLGKRVAWGKGIFDVEGQAKSFAMTGCAIDGAVLNGPDGGNASCVRLNDTMPVASFDGVTFTNCNDGILGGAKTVNITNSKFDHDGVNSGGYANVHNIYISAYTDTLNISNSYFGHVTPAHLVKSRAKNTFITNTQFENTDDGSYSIDIPNGGNVVVKNSVFVKGSASQRGSFGYGEEGIANDGRVNTYEFKNNIVINDGNARFMDGPGGTMNFHDNIIVGPPMDNADMLTNGANNKTFADRASAGLQAAPFLPTPQ